MWFREVIWNYTFLGNLIAGLLVMALAVTLVAYLINRWESRKTKLVRTYIFFDIGETLYNLFDEILWATGFKKPYLGSYRGISIEQWWRCALKADDGNNFASALCNSNNFPQLDRIQKRYSAKLKNHVRQLLPYLRGNETVIEKLVLLNGQLYLMSPRVVLESVSESEESSGESSEDAKFLFHKANTKGSYVEWIKFFEEMTGEGEYLA